VEKSYSQICREHKLEKKNPANEEYLQEELGVHVCLTTCGNNSKIHGRVEI
jgi:hypothetical protein